MCVRVCVCVCVCVRASVRVCVSAYVGMISFNIPGETPRKRGESKISPYLSQNPHLAVPTAYSPREYPGIASEGASPTSEQSQN